MYDGDLQLALGYYIHGQSKQKKAAILKWLNNKCYRCRSYFFGCQFAFVTFPAGLFQLMTAVCLWKMCLCIVRLFKEFFVSFDIF